MKWMESLRLNVTIELNGAAKIVIIDGVRFASGESVPINWLIDAAIAEIPNRDSRKQEIAQAMAEQFGCAPVE